MTTYRGKELQPAVDLDSSAAVLEVMELEALLGLKVREELARARELPAGTFAEAAQELRARVDAALAEARARATEAGA